MIRIHRPAAPAVLTKKGKAHADEMCRLYDADPVACQRGEGRLEPKPDIYAHETVKDALLEAQHGKCAFCECKVTHQQSGDVEHFRPKRGYKQKESDPLGRPGYYWLAYEWTNLLVSCSKCNQQFKKNLFPLQRPSRRARCHHDDLAREEPLLIDPSSDNPDDHLTFDREFYRPLPSSKQGKCTIDTFGLNHPNRVEQRRDRLITLGMLKDARQRLAEACRVNTSPPEQAKLSELETYIVESQSDSAEYAAMARSIFR